MYSRSVSGVLVCHELCSFNLTPSVEYIPAWFPGASFQRIAKVNRPLFADIRYLGYDAAHAAHVSLNKSRSIPVVFILPVQTICAEERPPR